MSAAAEHRAQQARDTARQQPPPPWDRAHGFRPATASPLRARRARPRDGRVRSRSSVPSEASGPMSLAHFGDRGERRRAFLERDLAADEIVRLDARRAFVDRRDARIAQVLRRAASLRRNPCRRAPARRVEATSTPARCTSLLRSASGDRAAPDCAAAPRGRDGAAPCRAPPRPYTRARASLRSAPSSLSSMRLHVGMMDDRDAVAAALADCAALHARSRVLAARAGSARSRSPRPRCPTPRRAWFIIVNMYSRPRFSSPTR